MDLAHSLASLTEPQREAATYLGGPLMIVAGAGTGKTRAITHRIAFLHREVGIPLEQILAVTFTNKAAREMRERIYRLLEMPDNATLPIGTFHSRCAFILRRDAAAAGLDSNFTIIDESDQLSAIRKAMSEEDVDPKKVKPGQVQQVVNLAKMRLLLPSDIENEFVDSPIPYPKIYARYEAILEKNKALDFEDLIFRTVRLFRDREDVRRKWADRYPHIVVDEFQDTNHGQFLLTKALAQEHRQIAVVGDEDQAIYSWRGADIRNLLDFERSFPGLKIVRLERNYRSTATILSAASTVIANNTERLGKTLFTEDGEGSPIEFLLGDDDRMEGQLVAIEVEDLIDRGAPADEIAVFYRSHRLSRPVEDALRMRSVPYRIIGGVGFYDRAEVKDALAYLRLAVNPRDDLAFRRVVNVPARGFGEKSMTELELLAARTGESLYDSGYRLIEEPDFKGKAKTGLLLFLKMIEQWAELERDTAPNELLERVFVDTRYLTEGIGDPHSIDGAARMDNVQELRAAIADFQPTDSVHRTAEFLRELALDTSPAAKTEEQRPTVSLMSVHNAKGLEFDYVFVVGLDEGVFPNSRAMNDVERTGLEEERRLFYVAVTRARKRLWLSRPRRRMSFTGDFGESETSRFVGEMPPAVFSERARKTLRKVMRYDWAPEDPSKKSAVKPTPKLFAAATLRSASFQTAGGTFEVGDRVEHAHLGAGAIFKVAGIGAQQRVYIRFDNGNEQAFVARHVPLKRLED